MNEKVVVDPSALFPGSAFDCRAAAQRASEERAFERRRALDSQAAADATPQERIRIWEQLHALGLPLSDAHPLVAVVATQTKLTVRQIKDEQQRRRQLGQTKPSPQGS